ncbi:HAMP domain-containing sensor histidine kinase [Hathewaya histolytica]|uniref:histidine kinase n=1 Tax=Hathewaya histolytica TaxID=1498 RepID=A0A4U9RN49_HATHI|nr:HAMP domain-containing sensor histidine kinase [Hathewaya histolytica]VTQ90300.1 sensor histidine kinase [Hathewaya histolytica]
MRKKLMCCFSFALISILIVTSFLLIRVFDYKEEQLTKTYLRANNKLMEKLINENKISNRYKFNREEVRVTYIDKDGKVIFDTQLDKYELNNHSNREEFKMAMEKGEGISIRHSSSANKNMMYLATKLTSGNIIRSSIFVDNLKIIDKKFLNYYMFIIIMILLLALWLSIKLTYIIVKPIKDLDFTTSRIAKGELDRRVSITTNDELGKLGENFNFMAQKLEETIKDVLDKQNRLEAILECMDSGIIAVDRSFKIIMINPYAERIFGINRNIIGENLLDNIRDFELEKILTDNNDDYKEIKIMFPEEKELRIKTTDIINRNEHIGTVAVVQDITDIKKLENMRSQFVANVSHELKTPLTSIKGFAETLKEVEEPELREKFLGIINNESERLTRLINDILTLSHIEQQKELKEEVININDVLNEVCILIQPTANKKQIKLTLEDTKVGSILGDIDKFKQMLINLIDNAVKYTETNGCVKIIPKSYEGYFSISIEDNGVGIAKEEIPRLFERFYRVDKARSRANGGTGLGLAIVKHIIILFNGKIEVESELDKGSKFILKIPYNYKNI